MAERINRIRLEFKDDNFKLIYNTRKAVLIESDWNLKLYQYRDQIEVVEVLIESDWNLKQINEEWANRHMSINRIRLEFKEHHRCTEAVTQFLY